jgi:hypothetical protein
MIDPLHVPPVGADEIVARYVLQSSHVRRGDQTVKPDAFVPHPYQDLSVTRHVMATQDELWAIGAGVAALIGKTLHGRGDVNAAVILHQGLAVEPDPVDGNPNHANVVGWPVDKPAQKIIAQEIAANAIFVAAPAAG